MKKCIWLVPVLALVALPAGAQEKKVGVSLGYAFSTYLEEGGGSVPVGAYLSIGSHGKKLGFAVDLAYHRDSEFGFSLNTFTAGVGPKFGFGSGNAKPFFQTLALLRYDSFEGESDTNFGGMGGFGVDIPAGSKAFLRLGADFQIAFSEGENLKTLRLVAGITF